MDLCVTCNEEVESSHPAMECNICEKWEHMACVKERDRPDDALYGALVKCPTSRSILYVCSPCRKLGSIAKRFACHELELARVTNDLSRERLASAHEIVASKQIRTVVHGIGATKGRKCHINCKGARIV